MKGGEKMDGDPRQTIEDELWELHRAVVKMFLRIVREAPGQMPNTSMLSVIRQFLVDNGITYKNAPAGMKNLEEYLEELDALPFPENPS
jgi:hypothetical protein